MTRATRNPVDVLFAAVTAGTGLAFLGMALTSVNSLWLGMLFVFIAIWLGFFGSFFYRMSHV